MVRADIGGSDGLPLTTCVPFQRFVYGQLFTHMLWIHADSPAFLDMATAGDSRGVCGIFRRITLVSIATAVRPWHSRSLPR